MESLTGVVRAHEKQWRAEAGPNPLCTISPSIKTISPPGVSLWVETIRSMGRRSPLCTYWRRRRNLGTLGATRLFIDLPTRYRNLALSSTRTEISMGPPPDFPLTVVFMRSRLQRKPAAHGVRRHWASLERVLLAAWSAARSAVFTELPSARGMLLLFRSSGLPLLANRAERLWRRTLPLDRDDITAHLHKPCPNRGSLPSRAQHSLQCSWTPRIIV
jgi:hypothetical protein